MCICMQFGCSLKSCEGDLLGYQSAQWQACDWEEAGNLSQQLVDELHRRLVITQSMIIQALQGAEHVIF